MNIIDHTTSALLRLIAQKDQERIPKEDIEAYEKWGGNQREFTRKENYIFSNVLVWNGMGSVFLMALVLMIHPAEIVALPLMALLALNGFLGTFLWARLLIKRHEKKCSPGKRPHLDDRGYKERDMVQKSIDECRAFYPSFPWGEIEGMLKENVHRTTYWKQVRECLKVLKAVRAIQYSNDAVDVLLPVDPELYLQHMQRRSYQI